MYEKSLPAKTCLDRIGPRSNRYKPDSIPTYSVSMKPSLHINRHTLSKSTGVCNAVEYQCFVRACQALFSPCI